VVNAKKGKKVKDKNAPKRLLTAFLIWLGENREKIKEKNPGISVTDIAKKAGEEWKTIDDKSRWEKLRDVAVEKYKKDMAEYEANRKSDDEVEESNKKSSPKKKKSSPDKKKSSQTAGSSPSKSGSFKSKEYISSSGSESDEEKAKKPKKTALKQKKDPPPKEKKAESDVEEGLKSDLEEEILDSPEASSEGGDSESGSEEESMDED